MSTTVIHTIEHEIGIDGVLEIRIGDGDVDLRATDGPVVRVSTDPGDDLGRLVIVDRGSGSLSIRPTRGDLVGERWSGGGAVDLAIEAPRDATLVIDSSSGRITADGFTGEQRYRSASGDIRLRDVTGSLTVEAVSGDVDATVTATSAIAARTVSGDLALRAADIGTLRASTTSGDVRVAGRLHGPGPFTIESVSGDALLAIAGDVQIELQTVAGDLHSDIPGRSESRPGKRSMTIGNGGPTLSVRTMSGDVRLVRAAPVVRDAAPTIVAARSDPGETPDLATAADDARLTILRALERGEIDVAEAGRRLEALEAVDPLDSGAFDTDAPTTRQETTDA